VLVSDRYEPRLLQQLKWCPHTRSVSDADSVLNQKIQILRSYLLESLLKLVHLVYICHLNGTRRLMANKPPSERNTYGNILIVLTKDMCRIRARGETNPANALRDTRIGQKQVYEISREHGNLPIVIDNVFRSFPMSLPVHSSCSAQLATVEHLIREGTCWWRYLEACAGDGARSSRILPASMVLKYRSCRERQIEAWCSRQDLLNDRSFRRGKVR